MHIDRAVLVAKGVQQDRPALGALASVPVANRSLLEHALHTLRDAGVTRVALAVESTARERVRDILPRLKFPELTIESFEIEPNEGLEKLLTAAAVVTGHQEFVLHLGDSVTWDLRLDWGDGIFGPADSLVAVHASGAETNGVGGTSDDGATAAGRRMADLGVYVVGSEFLTAATSIAPRRDLATQAQGALALLAEHGGKTRYSAQHESWRYTGQPRSLLEANRLALARLSGRPAAPPVGSKSEVHPPVDIHPTAAVEASVIRGPVAIGAGCRIREAYLGPYTVVGNAVEIEGAEMSYSVVMDGAVIRHLNERLEASIIGPNARVCRGFRLPRAIRLEVGAGAKILLA